MNLYDSSAIINLCGEKKVDELLEGWTLNLAFYEIGNAVWKQVHIQKILTAEEADIILDSLTQILRAMKKPEVEEALEILRIAIKEGITYYDASYIHAAAKNSLTLVTDDERLIKIGRKYVKTMRSSELLETNKRS